MITAYIYPDLLQFHLWKKANAVSYCDVMHCIKASNCGKFKSLFKSKQLWKILIGPLQFEICYCCAILVPHWVTFTTLLSWFSNQQINNIFHIFTKKSSFDVSCLEDNIGIKHGFSCINIHQVPWEVLKTEAEGRGFQHLPRDLANVNALKAMFDHY